MTSLNTELRDTTKLHASKLTDDELHTETKRLIADARKQQPNVSAKPDDKHASQMTTEEYEAEMRRLTKR